MSYIPVTPFRRAVDACRLDRIAGADSPLPSGAASKWDILRDLGTARAAFGLSNRTLSVLQALLSFQPGTVLGADAGARPVVHPSNRAICERLNGMPVSTLRRHLAALVEAGLIARRDSPNGKRFVRRSGDTPEVYGFDLSALLLRRAEIAEAAGHARAKAEALARLRRKVSLMRRDLAALVAYGQDAHPGAANWDALGDLAALSARSLRRVPDPEMLHALEEKLAQGLRESRAALEIASAEMSADDARIERHDQNSKTDSYDSETAARGVETASDSPSASCDTKEAEKALPDRAPSPVPLGMVLRNCPAFRTYLPDQPARGWRDLRGIAERLRPMLGIPGGVWSEALRHMGPDIASAVVLAILQRADRIRSPGAYLRTLARKAETGSFSGLAMIAALPPHPSSQL